MKSASQKQEKHGDGGTFVAEETRDAIEELVDIADLNGTDTVFVSSESSLGKEFMMGFKGIGALLRYKRLPLLALLQTFFKATQQVYLTDFRCLFGGESF